MRGSNPRPLAHKTNTLPTELMELSFWGRTGYKGLWPVGGGMISVRGLVVMIVACQVMDPGSIPGERIFCFLLFCIFCWPLVSRWPVPGHTKALRSRSGVRTGGWQEARGCGRVGGAGARCYARP